MKMYKKQMHQADACAGNPRKNPLIKSKGRIMQNWEPGEELQHHNYRSINVFRDAVPYENLDEDRRRSIKTKTMI
jgi:hypothetical protein